MRTTDISKYKEKEAKKKGTGNVGPAKTVLNCAVKVLLTILLVCFIAGVIVCFNVLIYLVGLASQPSGIDLDARSLNLSSFVYVQNPETEKFEEYQILYGSENRKWIEYDQMPPHLFDAIIAIEDKRFPEHNGVDWRRTGSAVINLALKGDDSYGGSTITQQLIKNLTQDDEASINRKVREIVKALKVEQEYSKDEILEAYLNVVNFGGSCQGVEAAANRYFDKSISECSIAECAAIVGITQNPSAWDPFIYPDNNKIRRELIIDEMYDQEKITKEEYDAAMEESANMQFADPSEGNVDINVGDVQNWYQDELVYDLAADLAEYYNITEDAAIDKLYTEGYKIYSAMDVEAQKIIEEEALNIDKESDPGLQIGMSLVAPDGRVIATAGSSEKKEANLIHNRATMSFLQPGSSIKPVVAYPYALERNLIHYSSYIPDEPLESWVYDDGTHGPYNWYDTKNKNGLMTFDAIEWSSNCCAAQCIDMIGGAEVAYDHATTHLGLTHLNEDDRYSIASLSLGGMNGGVSVREMANAYTYLINGGMHYEPYTYYYVTDSRDNVILDNRERVGIQAYSKDTATIMNRLLNYNIENSVSTGAGNAAVYGWEICGKTGTTNDDKDSWFCGVSPYAALAVWTGFDDPAEIWNTQNATLTFSRVMSRYLEDKEYKDYDLAEGVVEAEYCTITGKLADKTCKSKATGYYTEDNMPSKCTSHAGFIEDATKPTGSENDKTEPSTEATVGIDIIIPTNAETVPATTEPVETTNGN
ncbi:MAG: transglycosylase domain-containing protein [Ruminococcus sp.]|nr:transglycosylase domain-containing protein [Ruminococcus sp.]